MRHPETDEIPARRRKRLVFRACHRGIREMDILLGGYAKRRIAGLGEAELDRFEALLDEPDQLLLAWLTGQAPAPDHLDLAMLDAIRRDAMLAQDK